MEAEATTSPVSVCPYAVHCISQGCFRPEIDRDECESTSVESEATRAPGEAMTDDMHPNLSLMKHLNLKDLDACETMFADDFVWHYFNQRMPEIDGVYRGVDGLKNFFAKLGKNSNGDFEVNPIDIRTAGDELVVTQVRNCMTLDSTSFEFDAVVVWRIVNGKLAEAWDIPAVNTIRTVNKR